MLNGFIIILTRWIDFKGWQTSDFGVNSAKPPNGLHLTLKIKLPTFTPALLNAVCQPILLPSLDDRSGQTFSPHLIMDGWQWSRFLVLGYTSEPSVPRFNPRVVISEIGGGHRRYSHLYNRVW